MHKGSSASAQKNIVEECISHSENLATYRVKHSKEHSQKQCIRNRNDQIRDV